MEEKKNNTPYIIIIIVLLLAVGLLAFIAFSNKNNKEESSNNNNINATDKNSKEEEEEEENPVISETELNALADKIEAYNKGLVRFYPLNDISSLDNQNILQFAFINALTNDFKQALEVSEIDRIIKDYFGETKMVIYSDFICDGETNDSNCNRDTALYEFDNESNKYKQLEVSRGAFFVQLDDNHVKIESYEYDGEELVIKAKVLYGTYVQSSTHPPLYYTTLEDSKNDTNSIYEREGEIISDKKVEELLEKVTDITTYRFTKDSSNHYILQSVN